MFINPIKSTNFGHSNLPIKEMRYTMLTRSGEVLRLGARGRSIPKEMNSLYAEYPMYVNTVKDGKPQLERYYKIIQITGNPIKSKMVTDFIEDVKKEVKEGTRFLEEFIASQRGL
ncbi:MAG: hypothetical protein MJ231_01935 [bacterium]|nr:hypothetical protein [bacterium]